MQKLPLNFQIPTRGVESNGRTEFDDLLWEWCGIHERYGRLSNWNDVGWWYNERASVSLLAGAAGRAGAITLEEYFTDPAQTRRRPRKYKYVRQDLYLKIGHSQFVGEAKQLWMWLPSQPARLDRNLSASIDAAVNDAKAKDAYGAARVGVVFVVPYLELCSAAACDEALHQWYEMIQKFRCGAVAWVLPLRACRFPFSSRPNAKWKGELYPGCAIFLVRARDWK